MTSGIEPGSQESEHPPPAISPPHPSTIKDALRQATTLLHAATDTPQLEAQVLLAHTLDVSRTALLTHPELPVVRHQLTRYRHLVRRRSSGYPLPYLTGQIEFYGLTFEVTPEVLIPRPETETLVDLALARQPATIVDVGTGSGCIAISLTVHLPQATLYAIEISPAALGVAQRNAQRHGVARRVRMLVGNVLTPRPGPVDLIVSNPPYVPSGKCGLLPASVRNHEPRQALDGGPDGLVIVRQLLKQAPAILNTPGGALLIEIGADQGEAVRHLARIFFPHASVRVHPDLSGRDRVVEVET